MGRPKKSAPAPAELEPEEISQEEPDEEPAAILEPEPEEDDEEEAGGRSVNQADLVRKAVAAGHEKPATGVAYIKQHFGADIDPKYYSVAKSQLKKREAKASFSEPAKRGRKPKAISEAPAQATAPEAATPAAPVARATPAASNGDMMDDLVAVKALVSKLGAAQVHKIVGLFE